MEIKLLEGNQRRIHMWTNMKGNKNLIYLFDDISKLPGVVNITKRS